MGTDNRKVPFTLYSAEGDNRSLARGLENKDHYKNPLSK